MAATCASDKGSNVKKALTDMGEIDELFCKNHGANRAVLKGLGLTQAKDPVTKKKVSQNPLARKALDRMLFINTKYARKPEAARELAEKLSAHGYTVTGISKTGGVRWNTYMSMSSRQAIISGVVLQHAAEN